MMVMTAACLITMGAFAQTRYLNEVFASVKKTANVEYDSNMSVNLLYGNTLLPPSYTTPLYNAHLLCDIYEPNGDVVVKRPLIILAHTGSYLPAILNKQTTGNKDDSSIVEIANKFARMGYVVAAFNYRLGWNPATTIQEAATQQLIQATYKAMQDARNLVRYMRLNAATYKIDTSKIVMGGQGTGGYVAYGLATVSKRSDIESNNKFKRGDGNPMVSMDTLGDWLGLGGIAPYIFPGDPSVASNVHMMFNYGGAMGDTAWMKASSLPMVSLQTTRDPFAPYHTGNVIVPTTGTIVIPNASGAADVIPKANGKGINNKLNSLMYLDPISTRAKKVANGQNNLYGFETTYPIEGSSWEFWDKTIMQNTTSTSYRGIPLPANGREADSLSLLTNPYMSKARGKAYCDTIVKFVAPRIAVQLDLTGTSGLNAFDLITPANNVIMDVRDTMLPVALGWGKASVTGTSQITIYNIQIDSVNGNFSNPMISVPAIDTTGFLFTQKSLFQQFNTLPYGYAYPLKWRVTATNDYFGKNANADFNISIRRLPKVGINETDYSNFLTVYPNPATSDVRVGMDLTKSPITRISVLDITGREVSAFEGLNTHDQTISLNGMSAGLYFVNVTTANGANATKRLIVK